MNAKSLVFVTLVFFTSLLAIGQDAIREVFKERPVSRNDLEQMQSDINRAADLRQQDAEQAADLRQQEANDNALLVAAVGARNARDAHTDEVERLKAENENLLIQVGALSNRIDGYKKWIEVAKKKSFDAGFEAGVLAGEEKAKERVAAK